MAWLLKPWDSSTWCQRHYRKILWALSLGVVFMGVGLMHLRPVDFVQSWWVIVANVQSGRGYVCCLPDYVPSEGNQPTAQREPLPIYAFAWIGLLTRNAPWVFQGLQILANVLILFGVFCLARELAGLAAALAAALIWALYLPAVSLEKMITGDLLSCLFIVFAVLYFVRSLKNDRFSDWVKSGLFLGLAALSRFASLGLVLGLGVGFLVFRAMRARGEQAPGRWRMKVLGGVLIFAAVYSPWVIRNWLVFQQPVLSSTLMGYNVYRHNALVAQAGPLHYVGPKEALAQMERLIRHRPELQTRLNEAQVNEIFLAEAWALIRAHPLRYAQLAAYRFLPLWFNFGVVEQYGRSMQGLNYAVGLQQTLILLLFLFGLRKMDVLLLPVLMGLAVYLGAFLAVEAQLRYAVPVMPAVIAVAGRGLVRLLSVIPGPGAKSPA